MVAQIETYFFRVLPSERKLILFLALPLLELVVRGQEQGLLVVRHLRVLGAGDDPLHNAPGGILRRVRRLPGPRARAAGGRTGGAGGGRGVGGGGRDGVVSVAVADLAVGAVALVSSAWKGTRARIMTGFSTNFEVDINAHPSIHHRGLLGRNVSYN